MGVDHVALNPLNNVRMWSGGYFRDYANARFDPCRDKVPLGKELYPQFLFFQKYLLLTAAVCPYYIGRLPTSSRVSLLYRSLTYKQARNCPPPDVDYLALKVKRFNRVIIHVGFIYSFNFILLICCAPLWMHGSATATETVQLYISCEQFLPRLTWTSWQSYRRNSLLLRYCPKLTINFVHLPGITHSFCKLLKQARF